MHRLQTPHSSTAINWRHALLLLIVIGSLALVLTMQPIPQNPGYHDFADQRTLLSIPNFFDVISNIPFLLAGIAGLFFCNGNRLMSSRPAWLIFFAGVSLISAGSAYYHLHPNNDTLVWDRLPMTIAFMGLFVALLAEHVDASLVRYLLLPALLAGISSVLYWHWFDDLRLYVWIQFIPLLIIPFVMVLFPNKLSHQWLLLVALAFYLLAKVAEFYDREVFEVSQGLLSGHALKHLLAALSCFVVLTMFKIRKLAD